METPMPNVIDEAIQFLKIGKTDPGIDGVFVMLVKGNFANSLFHGQMADYCVASQTLQAVTNEKILSSKGDLVIDEKEIH